MIACCCMGFHMVQCGTVLWGWDGGGWWGGSVSWTVGCSGRCADLVWTANERKMISKMKKGTCPSVIMHMLCCLTSWVIGYCCWVNEDVVRDLLMSSAPHRWTESGMGASSKRRNKQLRDVCAVVRWNQGMLWMMNWTQSLLRARKKCACSFAE